MTTRTEFHADTAREFVAKARTYLAEDDLLQASEKGWGAAAHMVKAVAERRGWRHYGHRELFVVVNRLVEETGDEDIRAAFDSADALHVNFYEGMRPRETIEASLSRAAELVEKLEGLAG